MRSSYIATSAICGLLVTLVACSQPRSSATKGTGVDDVDGGSAQADGGEADGGPSGTADGDSSATDAGVTPDATVVGAGNDHCADATPIPLSAANPRVNLVTSTASATHDMDAPCSTGDSPDVFYKFAFSKRVFVYADTFGASWDTALFLLSDSCTPITTATMAGDSLCNEGSCGTSQSRIVALLEPGFYRLGLSGKNGAKGGATIHFEWTPAGSGTIAPLPKGVSVQTGTTVAGGGNIDGFDSKCLAAGAEDSYWWARCPADPGGALSASTCDGTTWGSIVDVQVPNSAASYKCSVEACGLQADLHSTIPAGAGLAVVSIDGQKGNDFGNYTMNVTRP